MSLFKTMTVALALCVAGPAFAAEPHSCKAVRFAETGWTDIAATTAVTSIILDALGYKTDSQLLSVPVAYSALSTGDIDVFLGYWNPSMTPDLQPYADKGTVETVRYNLVGAKYTLAVPQFAYDEGLKTFDDIAKYGDKLNYSIYGIEPGNDGNRTILSILDANAHGLGKFRLVESSEHAMLSEVEARIAARQPIVFLAWEPHPMNSRFKLAYLAGDEKFFGPNLGGAKVGTNVRKGYMQECGNVGQFLKNLEFALPMENEIMGRILDDKQEARPAALEWLKKNPQVLDKWLEGVTTFDGGDALTAVKTALQ